MKIELLYIYPRVKREVYEPLAIQFYDSLWKNDDHVRIRTGFPIVSFESIHTTESRGKDIGAYLRAARLSNADILICIGSHVRINYKGWLNRVVEVWEKCGPGLYGPFGSEQPIAHLRTTAFWCSPRLLREYPWPVETDQDRYNFEIHPKRSITAFAEFMDQQVLQVTGVTEYCEIFDPSVDRNEALMLDRFTDMVDAASK